MNCPNCGTFNNDGFKFCIKCGNTLEIPIPDVVEPVTTEDVFTEKPVEVVSMQSVEEISAPVQSAMNTYQQPVQSIPVQPTMNTYQQPVQPNPSVSVNQQTTNVDNNSLNFIKYIISFVLKPFETYKKEERKLANTKTGLILSGIVAVAMMIINLLTSMISVIFVKALDYSTFEYKTKIDFEGLKDLDYLSLIGKNLLIYVCIIAVITAVYYLASLVVKKSTNFIKTLSITASSLIPYVIMGMLVSPVLGKIWSPLSIVATIVGAVYSVIIFVLLISDNIYFERKDLCAYFHLACMTILSTVGYYTYMKIFTSGITNQISDYLNIFK